MSLVFMVVDVPEYILDTIHYLKEKAKWPYSCSSNKWTNCCSIREPPGLV